MYKSKVITLCGSTRFRKEFEEINKKLTLEGNIVISVAWFSHSDDQTPTFDQKDLLDVVHLRKIDISDEIYVIDVDGYIGESTRKEIEYAQSKGKVIRYLSKE